MTIPMTGDRRTIAFHKFVEQTHTKGCYVLTDAKITSAGVSFRIDFNPKVVARVRMEISLNAKHVKNLKVSEATRAAVNDLNKADLSDDSLNLSTYLEEDSEEVTFDFEDDREVVVEGDDKYSVVIPTSEKLQQLFLSNGIVGGQKRLDKVQFLGAICFWVPLNNNQDSEDSFVDLKNPVDGSYNSLYDSNLSDIEGGDQCIDISEELRKLDNQS